MTQPQSLLDASPQELIQAYRQAFSIIMARNAQGLANPLEHKAFHTSMYQIFERLVQHYDGLQQAQAVINKVKQ